ncbi:hypothetical protein ABID22_000966 [Pontibacter aydingkolensis]|uniref:DUF1439 domain-containing protein n=1 Tax=Pontibacter aydingkolensis TaxID=1911536 RepID=A0ABS7CTG5_9BACT|nr:hypothetical protein [Pontibacter aydingkolensis]MBW7466782.1 hypothetical protein [Pontibacter aydingkolensis]
MQRLVSGFILLVAFLSFGCKQASDIKAFTEAKYSLQEMHDLKLNGIDVMQKRNPSDFTTREGDSILASISENTLQASTTLYLQVQMQDPEIARQMTITRLKWQLLVDGEETLDGLVEKPLNLQNGLNELPINTIVKMTEQGGMRNYEELSKLMTLLAQKKDLRQKLTLQIKPTVQTPIGAIEVPEYITVSEPVNN